MRSSFDDIVINGLSKFDLHYFDWHYSLRKMFIGATIPTLIVKGKYNIMGWIIGLPLQAVGSYSAVLRGIELEAESDLGLKADGRMYLKNVNLKFKIKSHDLQLENPSGSNTVLSDVMQNFLNEVFDLMLRAQHPELQKMYGDLLATILKPFVDSLPLDVVSYITNANSLDKHRRKTNERLIAEAQATILQGSHLVYGFYPITLMLFT
ncbi:uncharacterized protein LOC108669216 [Hyalella azteca]|uniref:Uncharacterized protein LOC108669216 n=1 Tax=Hyalella azteca TaxID=294128 RepID=A0A8B7NEG1_HYAAZ|nr:uncharacterized protein LOC108669216 [Hyalella azteca]